ncbi:MAG: L-seryl-tRNA(Ser) seleniumtransferase [Myxococcota bacterium]|jgi:L-seryl-tRNA(Ser) seleniumtransferase
MEPNVSHYARMQAPGIGDGMPVSFRDLPAIHAILAAPKLGSLPPGLSAKIAREVLDELRDEIRAGTLTALPDVAERVADRVHQLLSGRMRSVLNATGVVVHTNLGRAPWPEQAVQAAAHASGYCNLEMSLDTGKRGGRTEGVRRLMCALTGAEDAVVVNNCAAALLLSLTALAQGREVLASRGELVEIGGSFRVPDIIQAGGATLVPVGTTNRTRVADFEAAASAGTAVLLTVHPSNFRIVGFTETADRVSRTELAHRLEILHVEDVGSGSLEEVNGEPGVRDSVAAGVDVVVFSGDKLLGGPQCGFAVGSAAAIRRLRRHPMYRAMRLDKTLIAACEATLGLALAGEDTPVSRMLKLQPDVLEARALQLVGLLESHGVKGSVTDVQSAAGGGAMPGLGLPSKACRVPCDRVDAVIRRLRMGSPAVLARIVDDAVVLDVRTLPDSALAEVAKQVARAVGRS